MWIVKSEELGQALELGVKILGFGDTIWFVQKAVSKENDERIQKSRLTAKCSSISTMEKNYGNTTYGSSLMDKRKHNICRIIKSASQFNNLVLTGRLKNLEPTYNGWTFASLEKSCIR